MKKFSCVQCSYKAYHKANLRRHTEVHLKINDVFCTLCKYETSSQNDLIQHMKDVHGMIRMNQCEECSYKSFRKSKLKEHQKPVYEKIKYNQCDQCDSKGNTRYVFTHHIKSVHDKTSTNNARNALTLRLKNLSWISISEMFI